MLVSVCLLIDFPSAVWLSQILCLLRSLASVCSASDSEPGRELGEPVVLVVVNRRRIFTVGKGTRKLTLL